MFYVKLENRKLINNSVLQSNLTCVIQLSLLEIIEIAKSLEQKLIPHFNLNNLNRKKCMLAIVNFKLDDNLPKKFDIKLILLY